MIYKYPEIFARFYDTIYHSVRDSADSEYFLDQAVKAEGKVLEAGVGTGRLFMSILNEGVDIYGLDISEAMLAVLYKKLDKNHHFRISQQNIIHFRYNFKFDLIIAPFRVFMHLMTKEDQIMALDSVYDNLNKNGKFIFDLFVPDLNQLLNGLKNIRDFEGEYTPGRKLRRFVSTTPDLINQVINVNFHLEWERGKDLKQDDWEVPMRFFFRYELEHIIERSKFLKNYKIFGDYREKELNQDSKEFVVVCKK